MAKVKKIRTTDGTVNIFDREIGSVEYAANQTRKMDIKERPNQIKHLKLHVRAGITTGAVGITLSADGPFNLIRNIKIRPSQGLVLKDFSAFNITLLNNYEFGTAAYNTFADVAATTTVDFAFDVLIPFEDHTNVFPERTILNTMSYNDLTLYLTYNEIATVFADWDTDDVLNYLYVDVISCERPPMGVGEETFVRQRMIGNEVAESVLTNTDVSSLLPENTMIKTVMAVVRDFQKVRSNAIIERLRVQYDSGDYEIRNLRAGACQSWNKQYYNVENVAVGVYVIEFDILHDYRSLFKTKDRNFARLILEPVVDQTGFVDIFRRRIATPKMVTQ